MYSLPSNRVTNWQGTAGVQGGIPNRTTIFATLSQGATLAQINTAITNANAQATSSGIGQVVKLNPGTYNLEAGFIAMKSNVTLRGSGGPWDPPANKTIIKSAGRGAGAYGGVIITFRGTGFGGGPLPANIPNWTGGYSQGSTSITVSSVTGLSIGQLIVLDQLNDSNYIAAELGAIMTGQNGNRLQHEIHEITNIVGTTLTISPGVYMPNFSATFSPQVWTCASFPVVYAGVEDLFVDAQNTPDAFEAHNIDFWWTKNCWAKNVESSYGSRQNIGVRYSKNLEIRHCYLHHGLGAGSANYGIENWSATQTLIEDNTLILISSQIVNNESHGCVIAYNYIYGAVWSDQFWLPQEIAMNHNAHSAFNLYEGNITSKLYADYIHGSGSHQTLFRNRSLGWETGRTDATHAVNIERYNRYYNLVGNVLGTAGYHSTYEILGGPGGFEDSRAIYKLGFFSTGNSGPEDPVVWTSMIRHGNYDVATDASDGSGNGIRWDSGSPDHVLPNSLYLAGKPAWFGVLPWPPVDPSAPNTTTTLSIPAGYRYLNGVDPPATAGPAISVNPSFLDFGTIQTGTTKTLLPSVTNTGTGTLSGSASVSAPYSVVSGSPYSIGAGLSADVGIRYSPIVQGTNNSSVTFTGGGGASASTTGTAVTVIASLNFMADDGVITLPFKLDGSNDVFQDTDNSLPLDGGKASYLFNVPVAGDYTIVADVNAPNSGSNSFFVNMDAEPTSPTMIWPITKFTSGFEERTVSWLGSSTDADNPEFPNKVFTLSQGTHELIFRGRESLTYLREITVTPVTVVPLPDPVANPHPIDHETDVPITTILTWDLAANATSYDVRFGITNSPPPVVASGLTTPSYAPSVSLSYSTVYYWQIISQNSRGTIFGPLWTFTTEAPPPTISNPRPPDGAPNVSLNPTLRWSGLGDTYDIAFDTSTPPAVVSTAQVINTYTPGTLASNTLYYWNVLAHRTTGDIQGPTWSFTTLDDSLDPVPSIINVI